MSLDYQDVPPGHLIVLDRPMAEFAPLHKVIDECVVEQALITVLCADGEVLELSVIRGENGELVYGDYPGSDEGHRLLEAMLLRGLALGGGSMILRSLLYEIDSASGLPLKELRGWVLNPSGSDLEQAVERQSPSAIKQAFAVDATTGQLLAVEPAVLYR